MNPRKRWKAVTTDYTALQAYDGVDPINLCLTQRQVALLKALLIPAYWSTRWTNLTITKDELNEEMSALDAALDEVCTLADPQLEVRTDPLNSCSLQQSPDGGIQWFEFANIEACIVISPTIIAIDVDITNNTTNIDINETNITNNETNITLINNGDISVNVYPPPPTESEPDELCGASWYIAEQLDGLIQETIIDAASIDLFEWLAKVLTSSGLFGILAEILYNLIAGSGNPNLDTEVTAAIPLVAEAFYCAELDRAAAIIAINTNPGITADAKTAYEAAIDSITDGTLALWSFVGSTDLTRDCTSFNCGNVQYFPGDPEVTIILGTDAGGYWSGVTGAPLTSELQFTITWPGQTILQIEPYFRAVHISGPDSAPRNLLQYHNGVLISSSPYYQSNGAWTWAPEAIVPDASGSMNYRAVVGWSAPNVWRIDIQWITLWVTL